VLVVLYGTTETIIHVVGSHKFSVADTITHFYSRNKTNYINFRAEIDDGDRRMQLFASKNRSSGMVSLSKSRISLTWKGSLSPRRLS
jgi:hypothetical protein